MIVLGLLLILAAVGATVFAVMAPSATAQTIELTALGVKVSASPLAMFVAGALSVILLGLGFALINRGARRSASSRKELRELRKGQADTAAQTSPETGQHSSRHRLNKESSTVDSADSNSADSNSADSNSADANTKTNTDANTKTNTDASARTSRDTGTDSSA